MKNKFFAGICCCLCIGVLSGCSSIGFDNGDLMRPPKTTGDEEKIIELIEKNSNNNYILKYPENGSNRSAIIMEDLDGDAQDEALAFYQSSNLSDTTTHILIMYEDENGWKIAGDTQVQNADIDRVEFADITGDGNPEIITGCKTFNSNSKQFSIYSYSNGKAKQIEVSQSYTSFVINDFNGDSLNDILVLSIGNDKNSDASLLCYFPDKNKVTLVASAPLDQSITAFESITSGKINQNQIGAAVDGTISADKLCTQIIYYDSDKNSLINGLFDKSNNLPNPTVRDGKTYCTDIDNDKIIEIPTLSKMPHSNSEDNDSVATKVTWNEYDSAADALAANLSMIVNYNAGYYFQLSESRADTVSAKINSGDNSMTIYSWYDGKIQEELFTIKVYSSEDWSTTGKSDGFSLLKQEGARAYCYKFAETESSQQFTDDEIQKSFILFSEYTQN